VRVPQVIAVTGVMLLSLVVPGHADRHVALVIGNNRYASLPAGEQLQKAANDARSVGGALQRIGFEVILGENLDRRALVGKLNEFVQRLAPGDTAFFFFSGHGVALEGVNYILPADVPDLAAGQETSLKAEALSEQYIVSEITGRGVRVAVVVLDACRTNPFSRPGAKGIGVTKGLSPPPQVQGVFSLYAASSGQAALDRLYDGDTDPNSVFSRVLAPALIRPGVDLASLAIEVREEVARIAKGAGYDQRPAYYDETIGGRVYLAAVPPAGGQPVTSLAPLAPQAPAPAAATPAAPDAPAQGGEPPLPQLVYSRWEKFCGREQDGREICFTGKEAHTEAGQQVVTAALIEPAGESKKLFRLTLPSPMQVQFGTRLIIDGSQPISGVFLRCLANGCVADFEATPELLAKLKKGQMLQIQAISLAAKTISFPLPLSDSSGESFRRASEGAPSTAPKVFEEQQKKLHAYAQMPPGDPANRGEPLVYSQWAKFCGKSQQATGTEVCFTGKDGRTKAGQAMLAAALIEPASEAKKLFRITLPTSVQLQYGARLIIDQDQPISGAFFTCFANGCMADFQATPELITRLKRGQTLQLRAIDEAGTAVTFPLPLSDASGNSFRRANEGPPSDPKVFEEQQKKLQADAQRRL
jgi:invasion protein IalB